MEVLMAPPGQLAATIALGSRPGPKRSGSFTDGFAGRELVSLALASGRSLWLWGHSSSRRWTFNQIWAVSRALASGRSGWCVLASEFRFSGEALYGRHHV